MAQVLGQIALTTVLKCFWKTAISLFMYISGGCMAPIWKDYYKGVQRIIFVVDAANLFQIGAASLLFLELLNNPFLQNAEVILN